MAELSGKIVLCIASTGSQGLAIAEKLAANRCKIVLSGRDGNALNKAVSYMHSLGYRDTTGVAYKSMCEATCRKKVLDFVLEKHKRVDVLVYNPETPIFSKGKRVLDTTDEEWSEILDGSVRGGFLITRDTVRIMHRTGGGTVCLISSMAAYDPGPGVYSFLGAGSVGKVALIGMMKVMAWDLAESYIRINCVAPGLIEKNLPPDEQEHASKSATGVAGGMGTKAARGSGLVQWENSVLTRGELDQEGALDTIPMRRLGTEEEVAEAVLFLISEKDASFITAETITVGGGLTSRL